MIKQILSLILAALCLMPLACKSVTPGEPGEPKETPGVVIVDPTVEPDFDDAIEFDFHSVPELDTLYKITMRVQIVESNGFAGVVSIDGGFWLSQTAYVKDTNRSQEYKESDRVSVLFYGKDFLTFETEEEVTLEDGCIFSCRYSIQNALKISVTGHDEWIVTGYDKKPILYFYPEEETIISAKLELNGHLTCTYPEHGTDGWRNFVAKPDGTLIGPDGKEYYALYWEGETDTIYDFSKGFCVEGSRTAEFLADILPKLGLSAREANEFIIYWLPLMQNNAYNLISFQKEAYTDSAKLMLSPEPDTLIRVFMAWRGLETPVEIEPQTIVTPERIGFTVVEWGGAQISE